MTAAELIAALDALGITARWLAVQCGRAAQTGERWRAGRTAVPEEVAIWLRAEMAHRAANPPPALDPYRPTPPGRAP